MYPSFHFVTSFPNLANFIAIARDSDGVAVVVGMSMLLIAGKFDLSVGSVMALSGSCRRG